MSLASAPDIISFAGGMPGNELFPLDEMDRIYNNLTESEKQTALQYGPTSGIPSLLESLTSYLETKGLPVKENRLLITTGSLQAIHILARAFIDPGDRVLVRIPLLSGHFLPSVPVSGAAGYPLRGDGMDMSLLAKELNSASPQPKFLICPNFHNLAGIIYSMEVKQQMIAFYVEGTYQ